MSCAVTSPEIELPLCLTAQNSPRYIASVSFLHLPLPLARTSYISPWQASCCRPFSNTPSHPVLFSIIQDRVEKPCPQWFQIGPFSTVTATNKPKIQTHNDIRLIGSRWSLNLSQAPDILVRIQDALIFAVQPIALSPCICISPKSAASVLAVLLVGQQCGSGSRGCIRLQHTDRSAHFSWSDIFILFPCSAS